LARESKVTTQEGDDTKKDDMGGSWRKKCSGAMRGNVAVAREGVGVGKKRALEKKNFIERKVVCYTPLKDELEDVGMKTERKYLEPTVFVFYIMIPFLNIKIVSFNWFHNHFQSFFVFFNC
jgi:hypothetical protein